MVKPRTGAGGVGVVVASSLRDERLEGLTAAPWVVQPVVESVRTTGETSVYVLGGRAVSQVDKVVRPERADEIRVHELYGGRSPPVDLGDGAGGAGRGGGARRRAPLGSRPVVRAGGHDGLGRRVGGQRARADRARPLPGCRPGERRAGSPTWCDPLALTQPFGRRGVPEAWSPSRRQSFTRWASDRQLALLRTAVLLTGDHHRAEDLVQDALAKVAARWARLRDRRPRPTPAR